MYFRNLHVSMMCVCVGGGGGERGPENYHRHRGMSLYLFRMGKAKHVGTVN